MSKISLIVPVYNVESYLHRCINSILVQTFSDFELILVDDGSSDKSGEICDEYAAADKRIRVFHQKNQGQAVARNFALDWVFNNNNSEFIAFVDSDDWIHPQYLELLKKALDQGYKMSACNFQAYKHIDEINLQNYRFSSKEVSPEYIYTRGEKKVYGYVWGSLYEKNLWKDIRFPVGMRWEDLAVFHKILFSISKVSLVDYKLYFYFHNPTGTVFSEWKPWKIDFIYVMENLLKDSLILERPEVFDAVQYMYTRSLSNRTYYLNEKKKIDPSVLSSLRFHQRKLRWYLIKNFNKFHLLSDNDLFSAAFPKTMWLFWTCIGISKKIKRKQ